MSSESGGGERDGAAGEDLEIVVFRRPRLELLRRRLRMAGRGGRVTVRRTGRYLASPQGRRVAANAVIGAVAVAAAVAAAGVLRRWMAPLERVAGALAPVFRAAKSAFGAVGQAVGAGRLIYPLQALWRFLRWGGLAATLQLYQRCPDCHARIHRDAAVCYRCHYRPAVERRRRLGRAGAGHGGSRRGTSRVRGGALSLRWLVRVLAFRLYRPCPDCRRPVHANARVCWRCGYRLRPPR